MKLHLMSFVTSGFAFLATPGSISAQPPSVTEPVVVQMSEIYRAHISFARPGTPSSGILPDGRPAIHPMTRRGGLLFAFNRKSESEVKEIARDARLNKRLLRIMNDQRLIAEGRVIGTFSNPSEGKYGLSLVFESETAAETGIAAIQALPHYAP